MLSAQELIAALFLEYGIEPEAGARETGDSALSIALRIPGGNPSQRVKRWRIGETRPDYEWTIRLLDGAGFITERGRLVLGLDPRRSVADAGARIDEVLPPRVDRQSARGRAERREASS